MTYGVAGWLGVGLVALVLLYAYLTPRPRLFDAPSPLRQGAMPLLYVGVVVALVAGLLWSQQEQGRDIDACIAAGGVPVATRFSFHCGGVTDR